MVEYDIMKMQGGVSMLYEYLLDTFGTNEPISVSDIKYGGYSRPWIDKSFLNYANRKRLSDMKEEFTIFHRKRHLVQVF